TPSSHPQGPVCADRGFAVACHRHVSDAGFTGPRPSVTLPVGTGGHVLVRANGGAGRPPIRLRPASHAGGYRPAVAREGTSRAAVRMRSAAAAGWEIITPCEASTSTGLAQARLAMNRTLAVPIVLSAVATRQ